MTHVDIAIPLDPRIRREWIKFQLRARGSSFSAVARELGIDRRNVQVALARPYLRVERAIAHKLGFEPQQLWPERFNADGSRKRAKPGPKSRADKNNSAREGHNVCEQGVA